MLRSPVPALVFTSMCLGCVVVSDSRTTAVDDEGSVMADTEAVPPTDPAESDTDADPGEDEPEGGSSGGQAPEAEPPATGEALFVMCAGCHGAEAEGTDLGYELRHVDREYARWVVRNGRPGTEFANSQMPAFDEAVLSDAALDAIVDYLDGFEQPTTPEGLYQDYCANCHGEDGTGGVVDCEINDRDIERLVASARGGHGGSAYGDRLGFMPRFDEGRLSEQELAAIGSLWGAPPD